MKSGLIKKSVITRGPLNRRSVITRLHCIYNFFVSEYDPPGSASTRSIDHPSSLTVRYRISSWRKLLGAEHPTGYYPPSWQDSHLVGAIFVQHPLRTVADPLVEVDEIRDYDCDYEFIHESPLCATRIRRECSRPCPSTSTNIILY